MSTSTTTTVAIAAIKDALKRLETLASRAQVSAYHLDTLRNALAEMDELRTMIGDLMTWMDEPEAPEATDVAEAAQ